LELGHTMAEAVREDAMAVLRRDPACETLLEVVMFMKGFLSLVIHRAARRAWKPDTTGSTVKGTRFVALLLQSHASSAFGVDIHPAAQIGAGVMIDHATGVVVGETATVGDGTTILHGVTLGGTGKESGDRHPKVGKDVLIGAGTKILGNIFVGDRAKIGAGSVVLRPIPTGATAVGAPAKIIG
ncbi:serine acetyl transferase, partial [Thalassiosira pseudonana CCMP1335]